MGKSTKRRQAAATRPAPSQNERWQFIMTAARLAAVILQIIDDYLSGRPGRFL